MAEQTIISFTTTPDRIDFIKPMIDSLLSQPKLYDRLILWLCRYYKRAGLFMSEKQVPGFILQSPIEVRFTSDFGSNTKLYPTLLESNNPNDIIITADDDTIYPKSWLEGLIKATVHDSTAAYGYRGKILEKSYFKLPFISQKLLKGYKYKNSKTYFSQHLNTTKTLDILTGVWGICYRRNFFDQSYFNLRLCPSALHNDDIWSNGHLAKNKIERKCLGISNSFQDIDMESEGIKRLWDNINNGKGLNDKTLKFFKSYW